MTKTIATVVLSTMIACMSGAAYSTSIDIPGVFFKDGHPTKGESLESSIRDPGQLDNLAQSVAILTRYPNITFEVAGHTDHYECTALECTDLALRRALLVYRHLLDAGIDPKRIISLAEYGSRRPIAGERTEYWVNQRVEINFALDP